MMAVTRAKYEFLYTLYVDFNWTAGMIGSMVDLKPWEVEAIIEQIDKDRGKVDNEINDVDKKAA